MVKRGDRVTAGQILARYVNDSQLAVLERQAKQKRQGAEEIQAAARIGERRFRVERSKLESLLSAAQRKVKTLEFLVARDAEPRIKLEEARGVIKGLESEQTRLILDFTSRGAAQENRARALEGEAVGVDAQLEGVKEKQLVRSPFTGEVGDVRMGAATASGISVEVVLISQEP